MPEMDGYETAEWLRSNPKTRHLPIIFVTAGMREDLHQFKGYGMGAVDYLMKPIEPVVLRSKVKVFCDLARQRQNIELHEKHLEELVQERTAHLSAALEALRLREEELKRANQAKDEFLATLAHELRNPLAPIRTGVYLLQQRGAADPETRQIHELIDRQSAHMARLIDDLLDVSRIERGKIELRKEVVDPRKVVAHALEVSQPLFQARNQILVLALSDHLPAIEGDPVRLEQMLCNLLNNACKFTPIGGEIQVSGAEEEAHLVLRIKDNGIGMRPEVIARVFDLFFQAGRAMDRPEGGLGIGLTLVRELAELHGGSVGASSEGPGNGSEFQVRLPAMAPAPVREPSPRAPLAVDHENPQKHVLIVDDDPNVRLSEELLLRSMDYRVSVAATGEKGIQLALALRPDIAIIDLGMPGLSGLEVAARIRAELGQGIHLIALTGYSRDSDVAMSLAAGFDQHLVKSGDPRELMKTLSQIGRTDGCDPLATTLPEE